MPDKNGGKTGRVETSSVESDPAPRQTKGPAGPGPAAGRSISVPASDGEFGTQLGKQFMDRRGELSSSRRKLIRQILDEADETYYLSSRELSERYDVHPATIIRTIQALGYEKFAAFANDLREYFVTQITPYSAMRAAERSTLTVKDRIQQSVNKDIENLNKLRAGLDTEVIEELANRINNARSIVVIGIDFAASLANVMSYGLVRLGFSSEAPTGSSGILQNKMKIMTPDDLLVAISFGKGLRETVEAVKSARRRKIPSFGITNGDTTPIAKYCDKYLIATIARTSFLDSYAAPVAAINAILVASAHSQSRRSLEYLRESEEEYAASNRWYDGS